MTTSGICEQFRFARPRRRKNGSVSSASVWKMAGVLLLLCAATATVSPAQTFRTVLRFDGANGAGPWGPLVQGLDGNFYGTTISGGAYVHGTVFKITPSGSRTILYNFCSQTNCTDGSQPSSLIQATDGNFYGTTGIGGAKDQGTIFKMTPSGSLTTLHSFCAQTKCADGYGPVGLVQGTDGNFYGTTTYPEGNFFRMTPSGALTILYSFCAEPNCTDGADPSQLIQATDGNFYGTTGGGGASGYGTVFKITPSGTLTTLHSFCPEFPAPCISGEAPVAGLVQASDGNFYGTTSGGGAYNTTSSTGGTVFKITPSGSLTTLYSFCAETGCTDGEQPLGLVHATDGNLYGTTEDGGIGCPSFVGCGTVFKMTASGTFTTLHRFDGTDGITSTGLTQATNGTFYGTTLAGGTDNAGTIFSLCVGLGWFVETLPTYGIVGATIHIIVPGPDVAGASQVTFNGIAAAFTVVSSHEIQATVPPGATTGYVRVTLPSGRIPSNKKFRVTPQITSFTPANGPVGTLVTITGVSLTQTWEVTIRGVHASFTVVDDGTVTATVPTGATTGTIRVTGPGGAATSTTNFTVD